MSDVGLYATGGSLVFKGSDGEPFTTSLVIAAETGVQHKNVVELIRGSLADFEEFGRVAFETRPVETAGGMQTREVANLSEPQATLLLTYMRNNETVRAFKKRLVRDFYTMRQALTQPVLDLSDPIAAIEAANLRSQQAVEIAKNERAARIEAETHAKALEAPAAAWSHMADSAGDYEVADAAKVLTRDPNIKIGRDRLFSFMAAEGWIYRNPATARWKAYQTQIECGRLAEKLGSPFLHHPTGEMRVPEPTIRVTPKGLAELHKRLGGSGQLAIVSEVPA